MGLTTPSSWRDARWFQFSKFLARVISVSVTGLQRLELIIVDAPSWVDSLTLGHLGASKGQKDELYGNHISRVLRILLYTFDLFRHQE